MSPFDPPPDDLPSGNLPGGDPSGGNTGNASGLSEGNLPAGTPPTGGSPGNTADPNGSREGEPPRGNPPTAELPGEGSGASVGNGMGGDTPTGGSAANGMSNGASGGTSTRAPYAGSPPPDEPFFAPPADPLPWSETAYGIESAPQDAYAMEVRAETLKNITYGDAVRRGEVDSLHAGKVAFADVVSGEERATISGKLTERSGRGAALVARKLETKIGGRMTISANGWKPASGEDGIVMGGALVDTWTGGLLIAAAMSDDLIAGAGVRLTSPADIWMSGLMGLQERPGTAQADGLLMDLAGTLFEREYGSGIHVAGVANFTGTVYQTQRVGFRPLMKVAMGVRNLIPGAGGAAGEQTPPTPPAAPAGAGEGAVVAHGAAGTATGSARSVDNFQDVGRVVGAVDEFEEVSTLRHQPDTAATLEDVTTAGRNLPVEPPSRVDAVELPPRNLPDGVDQQAIGSGIDDHIQELTDRIEVLEIVGTANLQEHLNVKIGEKLDELNDVAQTLGDIGTIPSKGDVDSSAIGSLADLSSLDDADTRAAMLEAELAKISWPGTVASGDDARRLQLEAEIDALAAARLAMQDGENPVEVLQALAQQSAELYGADDVRTIAFQDAQAYTNRIQSGIAVLEEDLDIYMLARGEVSQGHDPTVALQNALATGEISADMRIHTEQAIDWLNKNFDFNPRPPTNV